MVIQSIILRKMKLKKPKFWDYKNPNIFAYFLFPFSLILSLLNYIQNKFILKKNMNKNDGVYKICIGNIYVGGTGKTPISIEINKSKIEGQNKYILKLP